jgi:hypothetical protein
MREYPADLGGCVGDALGDGCERDLDGEMVKVVKADGRLFAAVGITRDLVEEND